MSNNLVSHPLSIPNKQMDAISDKLEVSIPNMRMGMMGGISNSPTPQQFEIPNKQMGLVEPMSNNFGFHNSPVLNRQVGQMDLQASNLGIQQFLMSNQQVGDMETMLNNMGSQNISLPIKRRAGEEPMFSNSVGQHLSMPNKNVAQMEPFTNNQLQQFSSPNKRTMQVHPKFGTPGSQNLPAPNKKMIPNESISGRSGAKQLQTLKSRTTPMEPSPKFQSFESVRSKMRESLASALALVTQRQDKASNEEINSENEVAMTLQQTQKDSQQAEAYADAADHVSKISEKPADGLPLKQSCSAAQSNDGQSTSQGILSKENMGDSAQTWKGDRQEVQCDTLLPNDDVSFGDSFFVKDELLQGNGLTWALDLDVDAGEAKEIQIAKKPELVNEDVSGEGRGETVSSPQSLAFKIELELFKFFGGVNKKYKEKGRSLLFNLKDRNNPDLRERVMSGEIPPERLCSMTAEELASEELSQWRMAKAEELAQMVVLPDSDVDIRRLVKKTHKGEFQVEVEQDDDVSVEVSVGTSSLSRVQLKKKDAEAHPSTKADEIKDKENVVGEKSSSKNQDLSCSLTITNDGTDLMQGLMVDEFKDTEFLPPIVSLDEFMQSLDSEPPFENLPVDGGKTIAHSDKESSKGSHELRPSDTCSKEPVDVAQEKSDKADANSDVKTKSMESPVEPKPSPPDVTSKGECVWEGVLQLNVSAVVTVVGFFRSGEKTTTNEWPSSLEIKGRVRLDAFEKFLQELPMSRSRAVMLVHFVLKEGSSDNDQANLGEAVHSYVLDERLGFAVAAAGAEIYFCPPHPRILEMLRKHLSKDHTEILNSIDNGLIGIVVWRKAHLSSAISPNSSSHHKNGSKKQHFTSRRQQEKDTDMNVKFSSKQTRPTGPPPTPTLTLPRTQIIDGSGGGGDDDDDDIPPGFGPSAARDEDDLPEFNFSGAPNLSLPKPTSQITPSRAPGRTPFHPASSATPRPVDQMRELIQKYGQSGYSVASRNVGIGIQPWNDDDDDIPEWQPQAPQPPMQNLQLQNLPHAPNQHPVPHQQQPRLQIAATPAALSQQPLVNMMHDLQNVAPSWQQGGRWVQQPPGAHGLRPSNLGTQPGGVRYYGAPRSRGF